MHWMNSLFDQYGYFVLFLGLFAESLALPFPGELAMAISGHMVVQGHIHMFWAILCSYFGATSGTMLTYLLGKKLGTPFFDKYGKYFLLKPKNILKITKWFEKYGNKIILVSHFIPGLRHFTGYVSGILGLRFRTFFIYNQIGAALWVAFYTMVGLLFGEKIEQLLHAASRYSIQLVICVVIGIAGVLIVRKHSKTRRVLRSSLSFYKVILQSLWMLWEKAFDLFSSWRCKHIFRYGICKVFVTRHRGQSITCQDGTTVRAGDWIGELHLDNGQVLGLLRSVGSNRAALSTARMSREAIKQISAALQTTPELAKVKALIGVTLLHRGITHGLGFELHHLESKWFRDFTSVYLNFLLQTLHPEGNQRIKHNKKLKPMMLVLSKMTLQDKFPLKSISN
ncbi:DedA family protein [Paenibacillus eucommiae]|uniref:Membrane protein DedA with SNARE-associated domain n=1 Tax=Paenibacillus eucommiae TaxID=1355755 RepID=A0ABS4J074_9BACL|nr:DedA family protein [Paenibacillus eucommiae]MBP1992725.1 membrane protein DedA with SNARE-associated domain [Paenibacillus eucommiae]